MKSRYYCAECMGEREYISKCTNGLLYYTCIIYNIVINMFVIFGIVLLFNLYTGYNL